MGPTLMMFLSNELPFQQAFDWTTQRQHIQGLMGMRNFVVVCIITINCDDDGVITSERFLNETRLNLLVCVCPSMCK